MLMSNRYGDLSWDAPESAEVPARQASRRSARRRAVQSERTSRLPLVDLAGVELHAISEKQTIEHIIAELDEGRGGVVVTPNLDYLRRCNRDLQFAAMVSEADLAVPDGMPLIWASRLQATPLPERVAGSNLISSMNSAAAAHGKSIFLLGGSPGAAEGAAQVLKERHPNLKIAGIHFPPFGFDRNPRLWDAMEKSIVQAQPDIVWVALGAPKQEKTICRLQALLPQTWWLGVGNSFSFLAGQVQRAPRWMQVTGTEWIHRLYQEPGKLWKRYLISGIPFAMRMLLSSAYRGVPNRVRQWRYGGQETPVAAELLETVRALTNGHSIDNPSTNGVGGNHSIAATGQAAASISLQLQSSHDASVVDRAPEAPAESMSGPVGRIHRAAPTHTSEYILSHLRALILLGGSVRPSPLSAAAGRSILDLPLDENGSLMNFWLAQSMEVARLVGLEKLPVRVLVNQASREPTSAGENYFGMFRVERDLSEYRGTGGVLRDVAADYADDDFVLIANACQILLDPLSAITAALAKQGGDVNLVAHDDGTPTGVQLLRCKTLREIGHNGYHDLKEQALPGIAAKFDVRAMRRRRPTGLPIRTLEDYIQGLRLYHRRRAGKPINTDPLVEDWSASFSLVERGAHVAAGARVHDSVVLAGATVESGAVLVRCLVSKDAVIRSDRTAVDQYLTAAPKGPVAPLPVAATW